MLKPFFFLSCSHTVWLIQISEFCTEKVKDFAHYYNAIIKPRRTEGGTGAREMLESFSRRRLKKLLQKLPPKFQKLLPTFQKLLPKFLDIFV